MDASQVLLWYLLNVISTNSTNSGHPINTNAPSAVNPNILYYHKNLH